MPSIDLSPIAKEKLEKIKEEYGCKTYSEAVNILLLFYEQKRKSNSQ